MEFDDENFEEEVLEADGPVLIDFWGSWCTACQRMRPVVEKLKKKWDGKIKIGYLNVDKNPQISSKYEIEKTLTHILFEDGEVVERRMGALAGRQLKEMFEAAL